VLVRVAGTSGRTLYRGALRKLDPIAETTVTKPQPVDAIDFMYRIVKRIARRTMVTGNRHSWLVLTIAEGIVRIGSSWCANFQEQSATIEQRSDVFAMLNLGVQNLFVRQGKCSLGDDCLFMGWVRRFCTHEAQAENSVPKRIGWHQTFPECFGQEKRPETLVLLDSPAFVRIALVR
jgi:hypothetical protein